MPLDFRNATALFTATEEELAMALGIPVGDLRSYRQRPESVPDDVLARLADVLAERGRGMIRVAEMLGDEG